MILNTLDKSEMEVKRSEVEKTSYLKSIFVVKNRTRYTILNPNQKI